jgi:glucokinase
MPTQLPTPILALDFGGTKLAAAVVDVSTGAILAHERASTPAGEGAQACLQAMLRLGRAALRLCEPGEGAIQAVGASFGGPVSRDRRTVLRSMHVGDWQGMALPEQLEASFGAPAFMDNDANCAALGEWAFGAGIGAENLLYVQVSTGVGAGLILEGRLYRGAGLAGEFGHMTVLPGGPQCVCGGRGCVESLASGWALARDGREALEGSPQHGILRSLCAGDPGKISAQTVLEACRRGDPQAAQIVRRAFIYLGMGIASALCLVDPDRVVIGGGVARAREVIEPLLQAALQESLPPLLRGRARLEFAALEGRETLLGAALLTRGY